MTDALLLEPILVSAGGRSGTTLLMQLLGSSPRIAFDRIYPFEHRYLTYMIRWAQLLRAGSAPEEWTQAAMLMRKDEMMGPIPWKRAVGLAPDRETFWRDCFRDAWSRFSAGAPGATHYAEKTPPWLAGELDGLLRPMVLLPVRDPRDVFLSVVAFVAKRGRSGFGMQLGEDPRDFAPRLVRKQRRRLRSALRAEQTGSAHVVRYEAMVADLEAEAGRISGFLGIDLDPSPVIQERDCYAPHMTSPSPEASVQRWEREMTPEIAALFSAEIGEEMGALGYRA